VPGSLSIPLNRSFTTSAGSVLTYERDLQLPAAGPGAAASAARSLAMIGLERVTGYFDQSALAELRSLPLGTVREVEAAAAVAMAGSGAAVALDVRSRSEWDEVRPVRSDRVRHTPLGELLERVDDLPRDQPLLVYCKSGSRSAIAGSREVA
jgi:hydroxyacylglutathione hydrolase